eukprot:1769872-Rhodomonas_salina.1
MVQKRGAVPCSVLGWRLAWPPASAPHYRAAADLVEALEVASQSRRRSSGVLQDVKLLLRLLSLSASCPSCLSCCGMFDVSPPRGILDLIN